MKQSNKRVNLSGPKGNCVVRKVAASSRRPSGGFVKRDQSTGVYIGPSVDGTDKEYVKVLSGKVVHKKPSFA